MSEYRESEALINAAFESESLRALARLGEVRRYPTQSIIIGEGDLGGTLYMILVGRLRVFSLGENDREFVHGIYGPGEYVGEMSLDGGRRSAYVKTIEPTQCVVVARHEILAHISDYPEFAMDVITRLIRRARVATESSKTLALLDTYGRISRLLTGLSNSNGGGARIIPEKLTHQEIANRVGSSREMVSRIVKDLVDGGYLVAEARQFRILKDLPAGW